MAVTTQMIERVTSEQIGRCYKCFEGSKPFYMVQSESDDLTEYKVTAQYNKELKRWIFCCTCPSGAEGFANVKHPSGVCKHVRWSLAAAQEEKCALAEQVRLNEEAKAKRPVVTLSQEELDRFYSCRPDWQE